MLDVATIAQEIRALKTNGLLQDPTQLLISDSCTLILPYHKRLDAAREKALGNEKIGTTGKGIGPAYEERASRKAVLFGDLFQPDSLREKIEASIKEKNFLLENYYKEEPINVDSVMEELKPLTDELAPYRCKATSLIVH